MSEKKITGRLTGYTYQPDSMENPQTMLLADILYELQQANQLSEEAREEMKKRLPPLTRGQKDPSPGPVPRTDD